MSDRQPAAVRRPVLLGTCCRGVPPCRSAHPLCNSSACATPPLLVCSAEADLTRREIVDLDIRTGGLLSLTRQGPPQVGPKRRPTAGGAACFGLYSRAARHCAPLPSRARRFRVFWHAAPLPTCSMCLQAASLACAPPAAPQATGASNYHLDIHGPPGSEGAAARIWLLDSMNRFCPPLMFGWGCVAPDTLAWLNDTSAGLPAVPSLAFVHIPIPQVRRRLSTHMASFVGCCSRMTAQFLWSPLSWRPSYGLLALWHNQLRPPPLPAV